MDIYTGNPVSQGVAIGRIYMFKPRTAQIGQRVYGDSYEQRLRAYHTALDKAKAELSALAERLSAEGSERADILLAQRELLGDVVMRQEIEADLQDKQPDVAVDTAFRKYSAMLSEVPDHIIKERAVDFLDLNARMQRLLEGAPNSDLSALDEDCIVVAKELLPSDTATLDRRHVKGIAAETGGENSHAAIVARSYGIPAILGVTGLMECIQDGLPAILDARADGKLILNADGQTLAQYEKEYEAQALSMEHTRTFLGQEARTADGTRIDVMLNLASASDQELAYAKYSDGVGLFRTEFLYMDNHTAPGEEKQFEVYKRVLTAFKEKPVVLRTMDIGGDKPLPYLNLPSEANPFLGNRALRLCLSRTDLFRTQLRAALRAAEYGNLWLMFPMVTNMEDIELSKDFVQRVKQELLSEGKNVAPFKFGVMIEVPGMALLCDRVAEEVDFASLGTNDLCQYLMAADRMNPEVAHYYQGFHPGMLRLIRDVISAFDAAGKPIGVCGELGGDTRATELLLGLGLRKLSMSSGLAAVKQRIRDVELERAKETASRCLSMRTAGEILAHLKNKPQEG